jgi:DNA replication protein DnaC
MPMKAPVADPADPVLERAMRLGLVGLCAHWSDIKSEPWLVKLLDWEETARARRGLERRLASAKIGSFRSMPDFDWGWPKKIDRDLVEELFNLEFVTEPANLVFCGPNAVGKTMIAQNLADHALRRGHTVLFVTASEMLKDLADQASSAALSRRIKHYCQPELLVVDELGYLSYDNRYADLLFEVVSGRYQKRALVITTNKPFAEWNQIFPNATCVVTLIDRIVHRSEIISIEGESYRLKEAKERAAAKAAQRASARRAKRPNGSSAPAAAQPTESP